jgi:apolipoprotein N-acyltransferase
MRLIPVRAWALVVTSALLQVASFPIAGPLPAWRAALSWFALVPFLLALLEPARDEKPLRLRDSFMLGYLCGILWYIGNCYWIYQTMHIYGGLPEPVAFAILILFSLYLGLYHALFATIVSLLRSSDLGVKGALWLSPFAWVAVELARARITFFPWDLLGYSQVDNFLLTSLAPFAGVMAISFVVAAVNAMFAGLIARNSRKTIAGVFAIVAIVQIFGGVRAHLITQAPRRNAAVMMQENIAVGASGRDAKPLTLADEIAQFSGDSMLPKRFLGNSFGIDGMAVAGNGVWTAGGIGTAPTVIVWPEAPSHLLSNDPFFRASIAQLAKSTNAPAIIGSLGVDRSTVPQRGYYLYDSASLFDATGNYVSRYDKIHLVPWGEYIPFKQFFSFADKLTEGVGDMDRGHERSVFSTGGHAYGVFVCYESIFGDEVRQFVKNGAEVLVNISDDGWYGDSGAPWQHLNMARMRAIENHRWVLRDTNTGITTAIDPNGGMEAQAPRHVRGAYAFPFDFEPASNQTFYTRHGDWFAWLCAIVTVCALGLCLRPRLNLFLSMKSV